MYPRRAMMQNRNHLQHLTSFFSRFVASDAAYPIEMSFLMTKNHHNSFRWPLQNTHDSNELIPYIYFRRRECTTLQAVDDSLNFLRI